MKTYIITDGYSHKDKRKWEETEPTVSGKTRIVIVHSYVEEIITDEIAIMPYLSEARLGIDYLYRN